MNGAPCFSTHDIAVPPSTRESNRMRRSYDPLNGDVALQTHALPPRSAAVRPSPAHSRIVAVPMTTMYAGLMNQPPTRGCDGDTATCSPTSTSTTDLDGDTDLFLSLFEPTNDRGDRPYPYTRSKTRWRKRPNDELKYLRSQVTELERLIGTLRHSNPRPRLLRNENSQSEALRKLREESHRRKLADALDENRKLRAMVAGQFQVARSLQSAIDERLRLRARRLSWPTSAAAASDELIFALLDEEKELQYSVLDKVMEESGVARVFHPMFSSLQFKQSGSDVSFQHDEVRMLPFAVSDVARSLRNCLSFGDRVGPSKHCREIRMYDQYFHAVTADSFELPESQVAEATSRVLQLCVTQAQRTVVTWSGYVEYKGSKFIRLLEKTWIVLESIPLEQLGMPAMGERTHGTLMRVVVRLKPVQTEFDLQKPEDIKDMTSVVVSIYQRTGKRMLQAMVEQLRGGM